MTSTAQALQQQLKQLRARHAAGSISDAKYETERTALERKLLDHLVDAPDTAQGAAVPRRRAGVQTWALLGVVILAVAAAGYGLTGSPDMINTVPSTAGGQAAHDVSDEQMAVLVDRLAERMKANPDDVEGWVMLGRSYAAMGRMDQALDALGQAVKLRPEDADMLSEYADALAVQNGRQLEGEPMKYIERALKAQPDHLKALVLAGTAAFNRGDYAKAVEYFDRAIEVGPADSQLVQMAGGGAAEARQLGKLPERVKATGLPVAPAAAAARAEPVAAGTSRITGTVSIAPDLLAKASPEDAVFIFARAASGSRMPLALARKQVKDLPASFALDDSMAMSPAANLSTATEKLVVGARISKSGQPMPSPGDFEGLSTPVQNKADGVAIVIGNVLK